MSMGDYSNGDVCMQGFFIKSPPLHLFNNQPSWKRRHFVLSKSSKDGYLLMYHKGQLKKGCIEINESSEIEIGIGDSERMTTVRRMFKCQSTEVMTIKTKERIYYLIGTDSKEIEKWANFLFAASKEKETQLVPRHRSQSSPAYFNEGSAAINADDLHKDNDYEEIIADKKRPISDPSPQEPTVKTPIYEIPRKVGLRQRCLPGIHYVCEEQTEGKSEKEKEEESEMPYYASPSSIRAEVDHIIPEQRMPVENISYKSGDYMSMKNLPDSYEAPIQRGRLYAISGFSSFLQLPTQITSPAHFKASNRLKTLKNNEEDCPRVIKENVPFTCTSDESVTLPRSQENSKDVRATGTQELLESNTRSKEHPPENKTKPLTVVQLSKLLNKITDDSQLEEVDVLLPQNDAISCLTLKEAIGRVCVSQWKSPPHLSCIFHHGDHITAVNDLHVTSIDEIYLFIKRSTRKEVKLTIRRLPDSEMFPVKGCMCRTKEQGKEPS